MRKALRTRYCSEDGLRKGTALTPWYSGQNKFANQSGTGGFLKVRDVLPHSTVTPNLLLDLTKTVSEYETRVPYPH